MDMRTYLREIEHAATETLKLVWSERKRLAELKTRIASLTAGIEDTARRIEWLNQNPEFDDDGQATADYWDSYFGPEKERYHAEKRQPKLESLVAARAFSTNAQCASLLQYAKQGISLVHQRLEDCPEGRLIGSQGIKHIIWQGRNQAIHWDEGNFRLPVVTCFETLAREKDILFSEFRIRNLAVEVLELLDWRTFADFESDMLFFS
jgi:hypothetical protein